MSRTTTVLVTAALVALGTGALAASPAAAREGRRGIAVGEYHPGGRHGGWHHRRHFGFGFYPAPVYVGGFAAGGDCYSVARRRFIPGYGYAKRVYRVCDGERVY